MAFLKRLCDNFWVYVSPSKTNATKPPTPQTVPKVKKQPRPSSGAPRRSLTQDAVQLSRSMSTIERVDSWRVASAASQASTSKKRKRTLPVTPSIRAGRRRKIAKMDDEDMLDCTPDTKDYSDSDMIEDPAKHEDKYDEEEEYDEDDASEDNIRVTKSNSPPPTRGRSRTSRSPFKGYDYEQGSPEAEIDQSLVISEEEYTRDSPSGGKLKIISPTTLEFSKGVSTEELREQGWDDDHITLVQKLAMRGFEPLMPIYWQFNYNWLPDALFAQNNDAFISSVRGEHYRATLALSRLFELGSRIRDQDHVGKHARLRPEQVARKMLKEYIKWAEEDAGLNKKTMIPMLALVCRPRSVTANEMQENARQKLARIAARYREAFRVSQSIEASPVSRTSTILSYPVPTLYAIIASHTLVALVAYRPDDDDPDIKSVAFFDMKDKDYDVWNALALAITVCHVRNMQIRIAEETGIGRVSADYRDEREFEDDPDA